MVYFTLGDTPRIQTIPFYTHFEISLLSKKERYPSPIQIRRRKSRNTQTNRIQFQLEALEIVKALLFRDTSLTPIAPPNTYLLG